MKRPILAALLACAANAQAAGPNMRPGLWEITSQTEMPGLPMAMPAMTMQHCFTAADVAQGEKSVQPDAGDANCKVSGYSLQGNTATWTLQCDNMRGQGRMTYSGDSYSGSTELQMQSDGETQTMKQTMNARRVGDCAK
ncbi:DUF3617 domain-containing protein [Methylogaea oryzae]|uniref:DUF3617 family protein n=1 Tax=Methylogaea oryzae TaxID=1295382 RepID=A0A8D5AI73_9GAMM|nr:DUF3617 family protein [Methylogaea oryzae]BBL69434.1 hypothetical protein MoryE10_00400 [Methylogaea oryzae]